MSTVYVLISYRLAMKRPCGACAYHQCKIMGENVASYSTINSTCIVGTTKE